LNIEGRLDIQLSLDEQCCRQVQIKSSRPLAATRVFHGKTPEEVLKILPMLYNICGNAQAQAAETACLQAQGVAVTERQREDIARDMLVMIETAKEHLCRILIDWSGYLDEASAASDMKAVLKLSSSFKQSLFEEGVAFGEAARVKTDLNQAQVLIEQLDKLLEQAVFVNKPEDWFSLKNINALFEWAERGETLASRLLRQTRQLDWENLGINEVEFLPELDQSLLLKQFNATDAEEFIARPSWSNKSFESTSLARQKDHPLIKSASLEYENGLLIRLVARLLELAEIPSRLRKKLEMIEGIDASKNKTQIHSDSGIGLGQVEAARGRLVHCVKLERGIVKRYQILAPTEWNFHPAGVVAQGLKSLTTNDESLLRRQADMLINAIDPCVAYDIKVH